MLIELAKEGKPENIAEERNGVTNF